MNFHRKNGRAFHGAIDNGDITSRQRIRVIRCADGQPLDLSDLSAMRRRLRNRRWAKRVVIVCALGMIVCMALAWVLR